jgi:predicted lysophospholipase L1 biosynthesis ABC-type transport system permease subunit
MSAFSFRARAGAESVVARVLQYHVTPGYAEALGLRLVEGRFIATSDSNSPLQALVVNEAFVQAYMNDGQPVAGRRYQGLLAVPKVTTEIVGVVGNVLKDGLDRAPRPEIYLAHSAARGIGQVNLVVKTSSNPNAFVPTLRSILREVEPTAALGEVGALSTQLSASVAQPRFATAVLGAFAALALALAATGLYGVLTYSVSQRRREIGIRSALGATKTDVIKLIVRQGLASTLAGLALGVVLSLLATRLMQPLLFGITPLDWPSFAIMPMVLLVVALVACLLPARKAAATDPAITLRGE